MTLHEVAKETIRAIRKDWRKLRELDRFILIMLAYLFLGMCSTGLIADKALECARSGARYSLGEKECRP